MVLLMSYEESKMAGVSLRAGPSANTLFTEMMHT